MPLSIASLDTQVVTDNGGDLIQLTGEFPLGTVIEAFILIDGTPDPVEVPCYAGQPGEGNAALPRSSTVFTFVAPPLPRGGPYAVILRQGAEEADIQELQVANRSFSSTLFGYRNEVAPFTASGPRSLRDTDALATADVTPPLKG